MSNNNDKLAVIESPECTNCRHLEAVRIYPCYFCVARREDFNINAVRYGDYIKDCWAWNGYATMNEKEIPARIHVADADEYKCCVCCEHFISGSDETFCSLYKIPEPMLNLHLRDGDNEDDKCPSFECADDVIPVFATDSVNDDCESIDMTEEEANYILRGVS